MGASTLSALSGVGKGIKWLSNINMGLSFFLLLFFLAFGSTFFGLQALFVGIFDYLVSIPQNIFTVWVSDGVEIGGSATGRVAGWLDDLLLGLVDRVRAFRGRVPCAHLQGPDDPRICPGRADHSVDHVLCLVRHRRRHRHRSGTFGRGGGAITGAASVRPALRDMLAVILNENLAWIMSVIVVVILLLTYLVTSADSAVLIINTINAAGDEGPKARPHILFWGAALALVVGG
jgi:choline/glycine/proline betaine transport protein